MANWYEESFQKLEDKRLSIPKNDFRFFSMGRMSLTIKKTDDLSASCPECEQNKRLIEEMIISLPECLHSPKGRKAFESRKNQVEKHLRKVHQIRPAHYYSALYTFAGLVLGFLAGLLIGFLIHNELSANLLLGGSAVGLLIGQIYGKYADKRHYRRNLQI